MEEIAAVVNSSFLKGNFMTCVYTGNLGPVSVQEVLPPHPWYVYTSPSETSPRLPGYMEAKEYWTRKQLVGQFGWNIRRCEEYSINMKCIVSRWRIPH